MTAVWDAMFPTLRLEGAGARGFLQGQTSADLQSAPTGALIQSCWLTATGRVQALLEVRLDADGADVLLLAGEAETVAQGFDRVIFPADRVRLTTTRMQRRRQALSAGSVGEWLEGDAMPTLDSADLERWQLERGWPGSGELNGDTNPYELGLTSWVSLSKGCYLGQETMAKLASRDGVKQQLRFWSSPDPVSVGDRLSRGEDRAGSITSAVNDGMHGWIGLALVRRSMLDQTSLSGPDGQTLTLRRPSGVEDPPQT